MSLLATDGGATASCTGKDSGEKDETPELGWTVIAS